MNSLSIDWIIGGPLLVGLLVVSWWATAQSHEQLADPDDDRTVFLNELSLKLMLFSRGIFRVTVIRQSGNVHAERIVNGTAQDALRVALGTFRRAGIDAVHVIKNDETELQFSRLYHSHRGSKEGKKVGQAHIVLLERKPNFSPSAPTLSIHPIELTCDCGATTSIAYEKIAELRTCKNCTKDLTLTAVQVSQLEDDANSARKEAMERIKAGEKNVIVERKNSLLG